jgi:hypothetical protein
MKRAFVLDIRITHCKMTTPTPADAGELATTAVDS